MRRFLLFILSITILLFFVLVYRANNKDAYSKTNGTVYIAKKSNGFTIIRNGKPFKIRGASGKAEFKALSEANGNTIRVYDTTNLNAVLDEAHANNLAVIVDISLPKYNETYNLYDDDENNSLLKKNIKELVSTYKNHPALLFWNLGNEVDYPLTLTKNSFIKTFNSLIDIIHQIDPNHPVGTSLIPSRPQTIGIHLHSSKIDLIGFNSFGSLKLIKPMMKILSYTTFSLPYYISEYGSNGPWEEKLTSWKAPIEQTSTKKGEHYTERYYKFIGNDKKSLGNLVFFWGQKQERTHTWFSIFDERGRKSEVFHAVKSFWGDATPKSDLPPQIKYMLLDDKGANDQLIFMSNETKTARILLDTEIEGKIDSTFLYKWEVYEEGWDYNQSDIEDTPNKIISTKEKPDFKSFSFKVPEKAGPYRIFVYVYDKKGNFATTNTPFYVLNK